VFYARRVRCIAAIRHAAVLRWLLISAGVLIVRDSQQVKLMVVSGNVTLLVSFFSVI
jgi:hypothetical protein